MSNELAPLPFEQMQALAQRFWQRVRAAGPDECWDWTGYVIHYGQIGLGGRHGKRVYAHRASWMIHHGEIPNGLHVLHKCDNGRCTNPRHLFLGTPADNHKDCAQKGRASLPPVLRGNDHPRNGRKLSDKQVIEIRGSNEQTRILAARYGMSRSGIKYIRSGRNWRHLGE
jgi:hypothetical protein